MPVTGSPPRLSATPSGCIFGSLVPGLHRLAVIVRSDPGLDQKLQDIRSEARGKGIEPLVLEAPTGKALELAFARLRGERSEAIYVASGPLGSAKRTQINVLPNFHPRETRVLG
jgi:hypothetical protein